MRPVESTRPEPALITVRFSDGTTAELACPEALIGNPIARGIRQLAVAIGDAEWAPLDATVEHDAVLRAIGDRLPGGEELHVDPGWYPLVTDTHAQLLAVAPDYHAVEIRSVHGRLRYRAEHPATRLWPISAEAAKRSVRLCEWCGGEAMPTPHMYPGGWAMRLCPACGQFRMAWDSLWLRLIGRAER